MDAISREKFSTRDAIMLPTVMMARGTRCYSAISILRAHSREGGIAVCDILPVATSTTAHNRRDRRRNRNSLPVLPGKPYRRLAPPTRPTTVSSDYTDYTRGVFRLLWTADYVGRVYFASLNRGV